VKELSDIDIRHFKLSSGDEVISLVSKDDTDVVVIQQPMKMHSNLGQNSQSYYFTDWQPMAKLNTCAISKLHIISFVECADDVKEKYIKMCLDDESSANSGTYLDIESDSDELDMELDEYLDPLPDGNPTIH
jgi:hypothetical protein